jgi:orotidine-5'-phosphate decarboxylase
LVTPGIRASGDSVGDQKRIATAAQAVQDGSSLLVVGRPILESADPHQAALDLLREIEAARA